MLTKNDICKIISNVVDIPPSKISNIFLSYAELIKKELRRVGEIKIPDVGKIKVTISKQRISRNPLTGKQLIVPPRPKLKISINKSIKEEIAKIKVSYK